MKNIIRRQPNGRVVRVALTFFTGLMLGTNPLASGTIPSMIPPVISILLFGAACWKFYQGRKLDSDARNTDSLIFPAIFFAGLWQGLNIEEKDRKLFSELSRLNLNEAVLVEGLVEGDSTAPFRNAHHDRPSQDPVPEQGGASQGFRGANCINNQGRTEPEPA